jgi:hypothetical protein
VAHPPEEALMSSFSNVTAVRYVWRPAAIVGGWISGTLAVTCVAAAVVLGGATAAVQRAGTGPADALAPWLIVAEIFAAGALLAAMAYALFAAGDPDSRERDDTLA